MIKRPIKQIHPHRRHSFISPFASTFSRQFFRQSPADQHGAFFRRHAFCMSWRGYNSGAFAQANSMRVLRDERTIIMNRQKLPLTTAAPDLPIRITEIRLPERTGRHNLRNGQGVLE